MNKRELFFSAVRGEKLDRPVVTAWVHFLSDHLSGEQTAELHRSFVETYDWDVVKVMNDYRPPIPAGLVTLEDPASLREFKSLGLDEFCFAEQLKCLKILRDELGPDIALMDTCFDPYQQIFRGVGFDQAEYMWKHKSETISALEIIADNTCRYIAAVKSQGVEAIFLSINSAIREGFPRGTSQEVYEIFQRPFELQLLNAAEGMIRVLHAHGTGLNIDRVLDYPCEVFSLSDRLPNNPSLAELRKITDKCLMGGINETKFQERSLPALAQEIDDAFNQVGRNNFILSPGCTLPSFSPKRSLEFLRNYTRAGT